MKCASPKSPQHLCTEGLVGGMGWDGGNGVSSYMIHEPWNGETRPKLKEKVEIIL